MIKTFRDFHIHFEKGSDAAATPLLLLHGTGGDEHQLMELGRMIAPHAPLLGVRGREMEGTITRWFKRHGEGVFDLASLDTRQAELAAFIPAASAHFGFARKPVAVGYSNGGNIIGGVLMREPQVLGGAVLMRCMAGLEPKPGLALGGLPVLFLNGASDPLAPFQKQAKLAADLRAAGADVTQAVTSPGHGLSQTDARAAREWLQRQDASISA